MSLSEKNPEVLKHLQVLNRIKRETKIYRFEPYQWQKEFYAAGKIYRTRCMVAANRVGKTYSAAAEVAFHATGNYPQDWQGVVFKEPVVIWCGGVTNESLRDISQKTLLGGTGEDFGTGLIPKGLLGKASKRMAGIDGVVDTVKIRHKSGGQSQITFKSYEQGRDKWQGTAIDIVWLDEDPNNLGLYTECATRLMTKRGIMIVTFTPIYGVTEMLRHFYDMGDSVMIKNVTWDDCPHLSERDKAEMLAQYPEHERECRSKGIPMRGEGVVFPFSEDTLSVEAFKTPEYWPEIIGIDFGYDHPAATVKICLDPDTDTIYITSASKRAKMSPLEHCDVIRSMGGASHIPIAWPHDGMNTEKGSGTQLIKNYKQHRLNFLSMSARYASDKGGAQSKEKIVMDMYDRMKTGRLKVFSHLREWFEEYRNFHRKDNKINAKYDDLLSATFYAVMMVRFSSTKQRFNQEMPEGKYI